MRQASLIPNTLTLSRVVAVPIVFALLTNDLVLTAVGLVVVAALTDFLDGYLARALRATSRLGAILDPIADKIMILSFFGILFVHGTVPLWLLVVASIRNLSQMAAIPILLWWKGIAFRVHPKFIPKLASALSYVLIFFGFFAFVPVTFAYSSQLSIVICILSWILAALEIYIFAGYCPRFVQIYTGNHDTFE